MASLAYGPHRARNLRDWYLPDAAGTPAPTVACIHSGR